MIIETLVFFSFVALILIVGFVVSTIRRVKDKASGDTAESTYGKRSHKRHRGYYPSGIREETTDHLTPKVQRAERKRAQGGSKEQGPTA